MSAARGLSFLLEPVGATPGVVPEAPGADVAAQAEVAARFFRERVLPRAERIERRDFTLLRELLAEAGGLGLLEASSAVAGVALAEANGALGSWAVTFESQGAIGQWALRQYAGPALRERLVPAVQRGEAAVAWALTEAGSGSDALGGKARAVPDGDGWALSGSKQFITNAGFADCFVVFAGVAEVGLTAFVVERGAPGLSVGPEERKLGLRGSSTCPLMLERVQVPRADVLGAPGDGLAIAATLLGATRLRVGAALLGGMKAQLAQAVAWVSGRLQSGVPLARFGLTREKLARMLADAYAVESAVYRAAGAVDAQVAVGPSPVAAVEELAVEASLVKVLASERAGQLIDDCLQLHGGAGYLEDFPVERAFRDVRVARIFGGTDEVNRLQAARLLVERGVKGRVGLFDGTEPGWPPGEASVESLKRLVLLCLRVAWEAHGPALDGHQVVLGALADLSGDAFALDSVVARNRQLAQAGPLEPWRVAAAQRFADAAHARAREAARRALCACVSGEAAAEHLTSAAALEVFSGADAERRDDVLASAVEAAGGYPGRS